MGCVTYKQYLRKEATRLEKKLKNCNPKEKGQFKRELSYTKVHISKRLNKRLYNNEIVSLDGLNLL